MTFTLRPDEDIPTTRVLVCEACKRRIDTFAATASSEAIARAKRGHVCTTRTPQRPRGGDAA